MLHNRPAPAALKCKPLNMRTSSRAEGGGEVELKMVAGVGFEPHDLDLMRVASYQAALSRNLNRLGGDDWTRTSDPRLMKAVL